MSAEALYKLQAHRTIHLRGFDGRGAAAAITGATATGFTVSGVFRDMADFAVVMLYDADNFFEHPRLKYLPDFDFSGITLDFDIALSGLQSFDSVMSNWIDWATVDYETPSGTTGKIRLFDPASGTGIATPSSSRVAASATVNVSGSSPTDDAWIAVWYNNLALMYFQSSKPRKCTFAFFAGGPGIVHSITIDATTYSVAEPYPDGVSSSEIATQLAYQIGWSSVVSASASGNEVTIEALGDTGVDIECSASDGNAPATIYAAQANQAAQGLVEAINSGTGSASIPLIATRSGSMVTITAARAGLDGNRIRLYTQSGDSSLTLSASTLALSGGATSSSWHVSLAFDSHAATQIRRMWLTFAPALPFAEAYEDTEWSAVVTDWAVTDTYGHRALKVAGPGSVRVTSRDAWCSYSGSGWTQTAGWYDGGFSQVSSVSGDSVTVEYHCQSTHDLYIGTALYADYGAVAVTLDSVALDPLATASTDLSPCVTRRRIAQAVEAGHHVVTLTLAADAMFTFDFLEAAVLGDVPDAPATYAGVTAAIDYDTDHSYKLPPARLLWAMERLGLQGTLNEYVGVFWWNQRKRVGGGPKSCTVTFGGTWSAGDSVFLYFDASTLGKSVFPDDDGSTIAAHFAYFINQTYVALWAESSGTTLTIHQHSPLWSIAFSSSSDSAGGEINVSPSSAQLSGASDGVWTIDDSGAYMMNCAARAWHADLYAQAHALGRSVCSSLSMELVYPPEDIGTGKVFAARFYDGTAVETDTGFASLRSTHCAFSEAMATYQAAAYNEIAALMTAASLTPWLQFGEFVWWFFGRVRNVQIGYASWTAPISIGTVVAHGLTTGEQVLITGVGGCSAANGVWPVVVTDPTHFTLTGSSGNGTYTSGGLVNGAGMAFYDDETAGTAATALGRALASIWTQDDDPTAATTDVAFLRGRIKAHVDAIRTAVLAVYSSAKFELLYPCDVTYSGAYQTAAYPYPQGGRLNEAVNLPTEWLTKSGSGLDRMKFEALSWGSAYRNIDLAKEAIVFGQSDGMTWPLSDCAYLMPIFNGGCPVTQEFLAAVNVGVPLIALWAYDHACLTNQRLPLPTNARFVTTS